MTTMKPRNFAFAILLISLPATFSLADKPRLGLDGLSLTVAGRPAFVLLPPEEKRAKPIPWVFYAPTLPPYPDENERWMHEKFLAAGVAVAGIDVGEGMGSPKTHPAFDAFYDELTAKHGFAPKPCLLGRSRGGLAVCSWAIAHPDRMAGLAGIYPVFDWRTYPRVERAAGAYGLTIAQMTARQEELNPIARAGELAKAKVPALLVHGDMDTVVPLAENSGEFAKRYKEAGAESLVRLIVLPGQGHSGFKGFFQSQELVDFVIARAREGATAQPKKSAATSSNQNHDPQTQRYELTARASEIDSRAKEHPEIDFVFNKQGKPSDVEHAIVDTRVPPQGKLVIWLMGHNPALFERLSGYGFHAIQVHYANGWFGKLSKDAPADDDKYLGKIRLEAATGEDFSEAVAIPKPDGMQERALVFVKWLAKENPAGKWDQFLAPDGQALRWDRVVMSGSSHGSTTAARFAIHQKVDRVVMFCGPRDQLENWQALPSATPSNRFFGFSHVLDGGWSGDHYCRSWELLGLNKHGPIVNVDQSQPPYQNTRRLVTDADVSKNANRAHSSVVPGGAAVKDAAGQFIHEAVWRYLFTQPVDAVGEATPLDPGCLKDQRERK